MSIWIGSPTDIRQGPEAEEALQQTNDARYWHERWGIVEVDQARWQQAQAYEAETWMKILTYAESDRPHEHAALFNNYAELKQDLGDVLEIGCGPFTQLTTIQSGRTIKSITLLDPLIEQYKTHPHCAYKDGNLGGVPVSLRPIQAEQLFDEAAFDTIVCINVLEHVQDVWCVLGNIHNSLRSGGTLIMGEKTYDDYDPQKAYDIGHPIHIRKEVLNCVKSHYKLVFENGDYFIGLK